MKLIENMTLPEMERELAQQMAAHAKLVAQIDAIHNQKDYSDAVAEHFHFGMVGFRRDRKRVARTLDRAIANATKACDLYTRRDDAASRITALNKAIAYILSEPGADGLTVAQIQQVKRQKALDAAPQLKWERKGKGYASGDAYVEKIDDAFVVIDIAGKRLDRWYRTVKEAKAVAAMLTSGR